MSLLDKLKRAAKFEKKDHEVSQTAEPSISAPVIDEGIGYTDPICPYCHQALVKKPAQKKKCPRCGNFIYVRTRPSDRQKILVTEDQIPLVEEQWTQYYEQKEKERLQSNPEYRSMEAKFRKKWGKEPSVRDVRLALCNEHLIKHAKENNWGLYRNTKLEMAQILQKEKRGRDALQTYLEVCYIDLNGPENRGGLHDARLLKEYPPFDPRQAFLAPGVTGEVVDLADNLGSNLEEVKQVFMEMAQTVCVSMRLPVKPEKAWAKLAKTLRT